MIETTLKLIEEKLNEFYAFIDDVEPNMAVLSSIVGHDGAPLSESKDKVVISVVNIKNENAISTYQRSSNPRRDDVASIVSPPLYIDLYLLITANFEGNRVKYLEALKFISYTIRFFQQHRYFNKENLPGLNTALSQLTFTMENLDYQLLSHLFGMIGAKYLPSVHYKVRMFPYQESPVKYKTPVMKGGRNMAHMPVLTGAANGV